MISGDHRSPKISAVFATGQNWPYLIMTSMPSRVGVQQPAFGSVVDASGIQAKYLFQSIRAGSFDAKPSTEYKLDIRFPDGDLVAYRAAIACKASISSGETAHTDAWTRTNSRRHFTALGQKASIGFRPITRDRKSWREP
jgi:hypothetical protein